MKKHLLVDGYNLAYRSFYAVPDLHTQGGFPSNAITGWLRTLLKLQEREKPHAVYVFFDLGGGQRQLELLPSYKAQRKESPEAFLKQIPLIKELSTLMGFAVIEKEGVEADDCIASMAHRLAQDAQNAVYIVSADKDFAQLVSDRVYQLLPPATPKQSPDWICLDKNGVEAKWGIAPSQIVDYLALIGDSSDNIPGLPGVGPKTALSWLGTHQSLQGILEAHTSLRPERFQSLILSHQDLLKRNLDLITLRKDINLPPIQSPAADFEKLAERLEALEIFSLAKMFFKKSTKQSSFAFDDEL